jgi:hypothetical protein
MVDGFSGYPPDPHVLGLVAALARQHKWFWFVVVAVHHVALERFGLGAVILSGTVYMTIIGNSGGSGGCGGGD